MRRKLRVDFKLPRGRVQTYNLGVRDRVELTNPGDAQPLIIVRCLGDREVEIEVRATDEVLNAEDLRFLEESVPV